MKLSDLIRGCENITIKGSLDVEITGITSDSRQVKPGHLFAALKGNVTDGHQFLPSAIEMGAAAVLIDEKNQNQDLSSMTIISSRAIRPVFAHICDRFYGSPAKKLKLIGVTGTNGKTSTAHFTAELFNAAGIPTGYIGTIGHRFNEKSIAATATTPEANELSEILHCMQKAKITNVCMEVSSHALVLNRTSVLRFDTAIFTNLTQDHLDFHQNMENYLEAKSRLFQALRTDRSKGLAVLNGDDPASKKIAGSVPSGCSILTYGLENRADIMAQKIQLNSSTSEFRLTSPWGKAQIQIPLPGKFNISNALAAFSTVCSNGVKFDDAVKQLKIMSPVPGRMEIIDNHQPFSVVVDYAHTPDALENLLSSLKPLTRARLVVVFGCGGDRDRSKRPLMAETVSRFADISIITSDNPRTESFQKIINDMIPGMRNHSRYSVIINRREAINQAICLAKAGDVVVIAGKGHETYQTICRKNYPFDDRVEASNALERKGYYKSS